MKGLKIKIPTTIDYYIHYNMLKNEIDIGILGENKREIEKQRQKELIISIPILEQILQKFFRHEDNLRNKEIKEHIQLKENSKYLNLNEYGRHDNVVWVCICRIKMCD